MSKPLLVGITGGIGSGKSLICKIFSHLKTPVYDADSRARWLMNNNSDLIAKIKEAFGKQSYVDNLLNRNYLASTVFNNPEKLEILNKMVHPEVGKDFKTWVEKNLHNPYLIKEAALMFESGSHLLLNIVVNVHAPETLRIERVLQRDSFRTVEEIKKIIEKQLSDEERQKRAQFTITNDDSELVIPQVLALHSKFSKNKKPL